MHGTDGVGFDLLPVVSVNDPATVGFDEFARNHEREMPHDRDKVTLTLDGGLEDREAVVGVVIGHPLDVASRMERLFEALPRRRREQPRDGDLDRFFKRIARGKVLSPDAVRELGSV